MAQLGVAVDEHATVFEFGTEVTIPSGYPARYTVEDEVIYVIGGSGTRYLSVIRGADDTVPASHAVNVDVTSAPAGSGGGSGVTVDNQSDPPTEVTTLVAPGAAFDDATVRLVPCIVSDTEPDPSPGPGQFWLRTSDQIDQPYQLYVRNAEDDDWIRASAGVGFADIVGGGAGFGETAQRRVGVYEGDPTAGNFGGLIVVPGNGTSIELTPGDGSTVSRVRVANNGTYVHWGGQVNTFTMQIDDTGFFVFGLPTADPNLAGALWNDAGTLKVSAG